MNLAAELATFAETPRTVQNKCRIARLFDEVGPEAAAVLAAMIDDSRDERKTTVEVAAFMAERGHDIEARKYQDHRARRAADGCRCPKVGA